METEERIARLERSNRRLKAGFLGLGGLLGGLALLGAAAPPPKVVSAERFVLVDASGRERAELSSNTNAAALQFINPNGTPGVILTAGSDNAILLSDKSGEDRAALIASSDGTTNFSFYRDHGNQETMKMVDRPEGTAIGIRDHGGKDRINFGLSTKGAGLSIADANETIRSVIAEQGAMTFDKGGKIEWSSLGETMTQEERKKLMDLVNSTLKP